MWWCRFFSIWKKVFEVLLRRASGLRSRVRGESTLKRLVKGAHSRSSNASRNSSWSAPNMSAGMLEGMEHPCQSHKQRESETNFILGEIDGEHSPCLSQYFCSKARWMPPTDRGKLRSKVHHRTVFFVQQTIFRERIDMIYCCSIKYDMRVQINKTSAACPSSSGSSFKASCACIRSVYVM